MLRRLVLSIILLSATFGATAANDPAVREVPVDLGADETVAVLHPADPRAPSLAADDPEAAAGLWAGQLSGDAGRVHLVEAEDGSVGLVETGDGLRWVTLDGGHLVPAEPAGSDAADRPALDDDALEAAHGGQMMGTSSPVDGEVQILLDGDFEYWSSTRFDWDDHQLRVIHLVDLIYRHHFSIGFEVVDQHVTDVSDQPLTSNTICEPGGLLREFTGHWEIKRPTLDAQRELAHLFTGKSLNSGNTIGCAWIQQLETENAYGVSQSYGVGSLHRDVRLVAHEIGHNFAGEHDLALPTPGGPYDRENLTEPSSLMFPLVTTAQPFFSDTPGGTESTAAEQGLVKDGGNVDPMRSYATGRV